MVAVLSLWCGEGSAQDTHFTNNRFAPLHYNPANTGAFYGSYRLSGMYRDQYDSFILKGYQTKLINLDSPVKLGFQPHHWVGWGLHFISDKAGDLGFSTSGAIGGAAYHFAFDKNYKQVLTLGAQYGVISRKVKDPEMARFADVIFSGDPSMDQELLNSLEDSYNDLNVGLLYRANVSETTSLEVGGAAMHILGSDRERFQMNSVQRRINLHSRVRMQQAANIIFEPGVFVSLSNGANDIAGQFMMEYLLKDLDNTVVHFGLGYRLGDAAQVMGGLVYKGWHIGLAYDFTVSSAASYNNSLGGFEIGIQRIIKIYRKPDPDPVLFCPRF